LLTAGQERIRRRFTEGLPEKEKELKLQELRRARRARLALLEADWRQLEERGMTISRPEDLVSPELYLMGSDELLRAAQNAEHDT
jgi:hypothetical protein